MEITPAKKAERPSVDIGVTNRAQEAGGTKRSKTGHRLGVPVRVSKNTAGFPTKASLVPRG